MKNIFVIAFFLLIQQLYAQTYTYDSLKRQQLINSIDDVRNNQLDTAYGLIINEIKHIKESQYYSGDRSIFDSLVFIPVYNVQLNLQQTASSEKKGKNYSYYFDLYKNKPINRIIIFNNHFKYLATFYMLKDIYNEDVSFICFNDSDLKMYTAFICWDFKKGYSKKNISVLKKHLLANKFPIYFYANNFSRELFFIDKNSDPMVISKKRKIMSSELYFRRILNQTDLMNRSTDTVFKYIFDVCSRDTNYLVDHYYEFEIDSIKGNPVQIIEEDYGYSYTNLFNKYKHSHKLSNWLTIYYFNKKKQIEQKVSYYYKIKRSETKYIYDDKGILKKEIHLSLRYNPYPYDSVYKNKSFKYVPFDKDSLIYDTSIYYNNDIVKYDSLGRLIFNKHIDSQNICYWIDTSYTYSLNSDTISYISINYMNGDTTYLKEIKLKDSLNHIKSLLRYSRCGLENRKSIQFYDTLKRTHQFYGYDVKKTGDSLDWISIENYDNNWNLISFYRSFPYGVTGKMTPLYGERYKLIYDIKGNWIMKYRIYGKKVYPLTRRTIIYYE